MTAITLSRRSLKAAAIVAASLAAACSAQPGSGQEEGEADLRWSPASTEVEVGRDVRIAIRLEGPSGLVPLDPQAVAEARIDMGPEGMATMAAPLRSVTPASGESLAFETDLAMAGRWALKVTATVPGETEPVSGEVIITAKDE